MYCQLVTSTSAAIELHWPPNTFRCPILAGTPKFGSSSCRHITAVAAVENSSGRKKIADSTARLRWNPADQTPSRTLTGAWISVLPTSRAAVIQVDCHTVPSRKNLLQFAAPVN